MFGNVFFDLKNFLFHFLLFLPVCIVFSCLYKFVYRYQSLSIACPDFGTVLVQYLSSTCPKIEHLDPAALVGIVGRGIQDIVPMAELSDTAVIGRFGPNLGIGHGLFPTDIELGHKIVLVPQLEESNIQADMCRIQAVVLGKLGKHPVQVFDIIDVLHPRYGYGPCSFPIPP